jgi:hypothetical protein
MMFENSLCGEYLDKHGSKLEECRELLNEYCIMVNVEWIFLWIGTTTKMGKGGSFPGGKAPGAWSWPLTSN